MAHMLKYKTFDDLLVDVKSDFKKYDQQGLIDPQNLIKVVLRLNKQLGLRIHTTKEIVLEVNRNKVRLPNDFGALNFLLGLGSYKVKTYLPQGTHVEERIIGSVAPEYNPGPGETVDWCETPVDPVTPETECENIPIDQSTCCGNDSCTLTCTGNVVQLVQKFNYQTREYQELYPIHLVRSTENLSDFCPNRYWSSQMSAELKDGWLYTSFESGYVYLNYEGAMEDKEGNLLLLDHDLVNDYYEYALKKKILEDVIMNDDESNFQTLQLKLQLIEREYVKAKRVATSLVNTPDFKEIRDVYRANRNAMYSKYYDMFASNARLRLK